VKVTARKLARTVPLFPMFGVVAEMSWKRMRFWGILLALVASGTACAATLRGGLFEIEYADGEESLARKSLAVLQEAQREFAHRLPAGGEPVRVVICSTMGTFRIHARRLGRLPVEGIAQSEKGLIVVKAPGLRREALDYSGTLRHELVHVLLARNTDRAVLPLWLNEGIAMTVGKDFRWESMFRVARMYLYGRIIPYRELNFAFVAPHTGLEFGDAYAQSLSMTRFLIDRVGEATFWEMVYALNTMSFAEALQTKAGLSPGAFYREWRKSLWKVALVSSLVSGFSVFQLMAVLVIVAYWRKRRRGQQILRRWEEEEAEEGDVLLFPWELEDREPPYHWKESDEED